MEKKKVGLLRRAWRKLFRKETHGIIRVEQDGTIHIYGDVMVHGTISCSLSGSHYHHWDCRKTEPAMAGSKKP